ncbi:hypothetical protein KKC49_00825 [Patescibacteria group bacterium]|nr:hypothetical protein [Patescibacteria group bacterium]MBU4367396.1 hypothetical protein [Patescibacteria group bacterium]
MEKVRVDKDKLVNLLKNEPLIEHEFSLPMIADSFWDSKGGALYYGTGLCNSHAITIGMPFDILAMVLVAEKLRSALGLSKVFHHIADTHALCNLPESHAAILQKAAEIETVMNKVVQKLGLSHFVILRSSSFDSSLEYAAFMRQVDTQNGDNRNGEYAQRELADMLWYQVKHGVVIKLGWAASDFSFDERWYDDKFVRYFGKSLSFVYTKAGRAFNRKTRVAPYIAIAEEDRIILRDGEPVEEKFNRATQHLRGDVVNGAANYFAAICRLYERLVHHPLDKGSVPQKVQQIIDHIFE